MLREWGRLDVQDHVRLMCFCIPRQCLHASNGRGYQEEILGRPMRISLNRGQFRRTGLSGRMHNSCAGSGHFICSSWRASAAMIISAGKMPGYLVEVMTELRTYVFPLGLRTDPAAERSI